MQKVSAIFTGVLAIVMVGGIAMIVGCQRDQGPAGPAGPAGASGGTAACGTCHSVSTEVLAKQLQWENSQHAMGGHNDRSEAGCAPCHTSEGFRETLGTVHPKTALAKIDNATPQNCRTCHNIHKKYDRTDFDLATSTPVKLVRGGTYNVGKSNLCAECHQQRPVTPDPTVAHADTATIRVTSSRFGPHYGSQSSVLLGVGGYEIKGLTAYESSSHKTATNDGCVTCHMAPPYGNKAGGHTWRLAYDYNGVETLYVAACTKCHSTAKNFDINGQLTEIAALTKELKDILIAKKLLTDANLAVVGTYPMDQAGCLFNYRMLLGDKSGGVHNAKYYKALLKNSIAYMKK
ncbi:MAG: hypothetical protein Q8O92_02025 [Candidatus Latescibacter sp.]|nr:hypothetical protein [Candidatus Latescibacter sp.]